MSLSLAQSLRIGAVLEDCSHQLDILGHCLSVQIMKEQVWATPLQEEKRLIKIKSECQSISQQMSQLCFDLEDKQSFRSLLKVVEKMEMKKKNTQKEEELKKQIELKKQAILDKQDELNKLSLLRQELKDKAVEKRTWILTTECQLVLNKDQNTYDGIFQDLIQKDHLKLLQTQLSAEKTAHEEAMKFLQDQQKELWQQLNSWMQQSNKMQQDKQKQFYDVSCKSTLQLDKLMEMKRKIKAMEQVVMEDIKKEERQQQAEVRAATKLQAWWRGCMVRRGMGAFKKPEEKKTKKKEGKKKK